MSKIRVLEDRVANQIAAGEVIERPAAVVKELLENSLDAGATRIEVEFRNGGKSYMRIEDNGCGMTPDEAMMSLERHATSKIRETSDLEMVGTYGFRGEAVPSIASVSKFIMRTRSKDRELGCEILVNGGKWVHKQEYGMSVGTSIEASNLFNSVPVRRKFMKTDNTEAAHIIHLVRLYAVSHPEIGFTLLENGRQLFKSLPGSTLEERVAGIWGRKLVNELMSVESDDGSMKMWGLIGKPGVGRSTRSEMVTFVNNRPVESKALNYALIESYHTYITKGRFPVCFLFIEMDPTLVDVNVHPAKREVRFRQEGIIRQFIIRGILGRLKEASGKALEDFEQTEESHESIPSPIPQPIPEPIPVPRESFRTIAPEPIVEPPPVFIPTTTPHEVEVCTEQEEVAVKVLEKPIVIPDIEVEDEEVPAPRMNWKFLGRIKGGFGIFDTGEGMVVMNFKAANQRIYYERIEKAFNEAGVVMQPLLFPVSIELETRQSDALRAGLDLMGNAGFDIEEFGRNFYRVKALPDWMEPSTVEAFVLDAAGILMEEGVSKRAIKQTAHERLARLAVNSVRLPDAMSDEAVEALVVELFKTRNPLTCPKGRRIYLETTNSEISRKFGL